MNVISIRPYWYCVFNFQGSAQIFRSAVGLSRLELPTSRLSGVRSNLLSYKPVSVAYSISLSAEAARRLRVVSTLSHGHPLMSALQLSAVCEQAPTASTCNPAALKWRRRDSNSRPPACRAGALPAELRPLPLKGKPAATCSPTSSPM